MHNSDSLENEAFMAWPQTATVDRSDCYWINDIQKPGYRCSN